MREKNAKAFFISLLHVYVMDIWVSFTRFMSLSYYMYVPILLGSIVELTILSLALIRYFSPWFGLFPLVFFSVLLVFTKDFFPIFGKLFVRYLGFASV